MKRNMRVKVGLDSHPLSHLGLCIFGVHEVWINIGQSDDSIRRVLLGGQQGGDVSFKGILRWNRPVVNVKDQLRHFSFGSQFQKS